MITDLERKLAAAENQLNGAVQGKLDSLKRAGLYLCRGICYTVTLTLRASGFDGRIRRQALAVVNQYESRR